MKLGGWVVMLTAMIMFLTFVGLPTSLTSILDTLGVSINPDTAQLATADIESSNFWSQIFGSSVGILALLTVGGSLIIGFFAKSYDVSLVIVPLVIFIAGLYIPTFWGIIKYVATFNQWWMTSIIAIIFVSLSLGFALACVDYFAGR